MEDSTRAAPKLPAKHALLEDAPQIINGVVMCSGSADADSSAIAPHPGEGRTAGVLCEVPGMDAHALAAQGRARQTHRAVVSVRILRRARLDAAVFAGERGDKP